LTRTEDAGWTLDVVPGWLDTVDAVPVPPSLAGETRQRLVDQLRPGEYDTGYLRVEATLPDATGPSLLVMLGYHRLDGDFGAGAILVPETRRLFVAGGARAICYHHDGDRWWRQWEREVEVTVWGLARHGAHIVMSSELEVVVWDIKGVRRLSAGVEPPWSYDIQGNRMRLDVDGAVTTVDIPAG
jgi:hypothetical protein